jgi:hypothetical protein
LLDIVAEGDGGSSGVVDVASRKLDAARPQSMAWFMFKVPAESLEPPE